MESLNPFEFRTGLKHFPAAWVSKDHGLNPFEFRAGLKRCRRTDGQYLQVSLNLFEFRAGLNQYPWQLQHPERVLIPLNSGLA